MIASFLDNLQAKLDKVLAGQAPIQLSLHDELGNTVGVMRPLTAHHLEQNDVMEKLTDWRNANMGNFLTHFVATPQRTRSWVQNVLLRAKGQMLWLVYDQNEILVGHFGFKNLTTNFVLLDNAIRGERQGHPRLFLYAGKALVQWLWITTTVQRIDGIVMVENVSAIMMNRQIGFVGWKRHPLVKRVQEGKIQWDISEEGQISPDGRYCFTIWIKRDGNYSA
jgi:hypothetical protein